MVMFDQLRQELLLHPRDPVKLDRFFRQAVVDNRIESAKETFSRLLKRHPWAHPVRKVYIAACLHLKDYISAMDAVETLVAFTAQPDDALFDSALAVRDYLGPRTISDKGGHQFSLSVCMIVKNERTFLGPCLNAIKHLADEIIVVDTGSTDRSADIARIYGAHVHHFKWCDDFSAARNSALEKAQGDWILTLDADEIIAPRDHKVLRALIDDPVQQVRAYTIQTRNYTNLANAMEWQANDGSYPRHEAGIGWYPTNKVRLFPRWEKIRFVYPVHELVDPSIRSVDVPILNCPVPLHHYGHINEARNQQKARQYFDLGYAKLAQLGDDRIALRELAVQAGQLERWTESIDLWQRLLAITPDYGEAYANIGGAYWQLGNPEQGLIYSQHAVRVSPDLKEGQYNLAVNLILNGQVKDASAILEKLLCRHPDYLAAEFMLGVVCCLDGHHTKGGHILRSLEKKISGPALAIAIDDINKKLADSGLAAVSLELVNRSLQEAARA